MPKKNFSTKKPKYIRRYRTRNVRKGLSRLQIIRNRTAENSRPVQRLSYMGCPFPQQMVTQFTYSERITLTSTLGVPNNYQFAMNSIFDPNVSAGGNQPRWLDSLIGPNNSTAPYRSYMVFASQIRLLVIPQDSDTVAQRGIVGIGHLAPGTSTAVTLAEVRARKDYKTAFLGYFGGGTDKVLMKSDYQKIKHLVGVKDVEDNNSLRAAYNASPSSLCVWDIVFAPFNEATTSTVQILVDIKYYTKLYDRNDPADS